MNRSHHNRAINVVVLPITTSYTTNCQALDNAILAVTISKLRAKRVGEVIKGAAILANEIVAHIDTQGQFTDKQVYGAIKRLLGRFLVNEESAPVRWHNIAKDKIWMDRLKNLIYYRGELILAADVARLAENKLGIPARTIYNRCIMLNWSAERALSTPAHAGGRKPKAPETVAPELAISETAPSVADAPLSDFDREWIARQVAKRQAEAAKTYVANDNSSRDQDEEGTDDFRSAS